MKNVRSTKISRTIKKFSTAKGRLSTDFSTFECHVSAMENISQLAKLFLTNTVFLDHFCLLWLFIPIPLIVCGVSRGKIWFGGAVRMSFCDLVRENGIAGSSDLTFVLGVVIMKCMGKIQGYNYSTARELELR